MTGLALKKRARSNHSETNETSDDGNVAKKKRKLSIISSNVENDDTMNGTFPDEDLQSIESAQSKYLFTYLKINSFILHSGRSNPKTMFNFSRERVETK